MDKKRDRNWADLPDEILELILIHLPYIDHLCFGAICASWHSAVAKKLCRPAPQLPWMIFFGNFESTSCSIYSLSDNKVRTLSLPAFHGMRCIGSSHGWLITLNKSGDMSLWNPFSKDPKVQLPPPPQCTRTLELILRCSSFVIAMVRGEGRAALVGLSPISYKINYLLERLPFPEGVSTQFMQKNFCFSLLSKVALSSSTQPGDSALMIIYGIHRDVAFWRPGDSSWTALEGEGMCHDILYYKKRFYAVRRYREFAMVWDISGTSRFPKATKIPLPSNLGIINRDFACKYLVDLAGDLLLVIRSYNIETDYDMNTTIATTTDFEAFKLDQSGQLWTQVTCLGDYAMFLGVHQSMSYPTNSFPGCRRNCIYFCDDMWDVCYDVSPPRGFDLGIFNFEDGSIDRFHGISTWGSMPQSMWFTPNPW